MGDHLASIAGSGPLLPAIAVSALAGLVSILSPCVLPLVPGYLSYVTGLAGSELDATGLAGSKLDATTPQAAGGVAVASRTAGRGRVLAGTVLFVLGFAVVFSLTASLVANIAFALYSHRDVLNVVLGVLLILLGLGYLGWLPGLQREMRITRLPAAGLVGAPIFGGIFALSWLPCTGPTLSVVLALGTTSGQTSRAVILALAFSLGLGIPFVLFGLFFRTLLGVFRTIRRNSRWVTRAGGALLILVGIALVSGSWNHFLAWLLTTFNFDAGTLL